MVYTCPPSIWEMKGKVIEAKVWLHKTLPQKGKKAEVEEGDKEKKES